MHVQELEMIARHRLKLLVCVLNNGAYGAEIHKLRADGIDDSGSVFGRTDLEAIATGFGLRGANVTKLSSRRSWKRSRRRTAPRSGTFRSQTRW
jgi:thiamine pyrophosphate-dependent acetolactate synthase large subunit-like protein